MNDSAFKHHKWPIRLSNNPTVTIELCLDHDEIDEITETVNRLEIDLRAAGDEKKANNLVDVMDLLTIIRSRLT